MEKPKLCILFEGPGYKLALSQLRLTDGLQREDLSGEFNAQLVCV